MLLMCARLCASAYILCCLCVRLPITFGALVTSNSTWGLSPSLFRLSALLVPFFKVCFVPYANKACLRFNQSILSLPLSPPVRQQSVLFKWLIIFPLPIPVSLDFWDCWLLCNRWPDRQTSTLCDVGQLGSEKSQHWSKFSQAWDAHEF